MISNHRPSGFSCGGGRGVHHSVACGGQPEPQKPVEAVVIRLVLFRSPLDCLNLMNVGQILKDKFS